MEKTKEKKKSSKQVRISLSDYEIIRRIAFKKHMTMIEVLEEIIKLHEGLGK